MVRHAGPVLLAAACLGAGGLVGWVLSGWCLPGRTTAREAELARRCAVEPDVTLRRWTHVVLHHSATAVGNARLFDAYHRETKGWAHGLGYHFVIGNGTRSGDGEIEVGERWIRQQVGAHCAAGGMNRTAIGICFVGNFESDAGPTAAQIEAGTALIRHVARQFGIPPEHVIGHREAPGANTACPGRSFPIQRMRAAARTAR